MTSPQRPRIGLLSLSAIPDDPRVRRQGDQLTREGWDVVAVGLPGYRSAPTTWKYVHAVSLATDDPEVVRLTLRQRVRAWLKKRPALHRRVRTLLWPLRFAKWCGRVVRLRITPRCASQLFWQIDPNLAVIRELALPIQVDLWLANDWTMLPIARELSAKWGVPFCYDTHELALDEYAHLLRWRLARKPIITAVESVGIREAAYATCVSGGIADRLAEVYQLPVKPTVIRNAPIYSEQKYRPCGEKIQVLYHGIVAPGRGLEVTIASVPQWRADFHFTIRGPALPDYLESLKKLVASYRVGDRVTFAPPVAMTDLVAAANEFDVGFFALPDNSLQNHYVLPNKFFEYTMAGLALCVSDLPEMQRLVDEFNLGVLMPDMSADAIAQAINKMERAQINAYKANALAAAKVLNWDHEGAKLVQLCRQALTSPVQTKREPTVT